MVIKIKDYLLISKKLLDIAQKDGIGKKTVKLLIKKGDTVLVLKRAKSVNFPDFYELPGGGLNENEDIFTGAKRELFEETGLAIKKFISQLEIIDFNKNIRNKKIGRQYTFLILSENKDITLNPGEHSDYKWVSLSELDSLVMFAKTHEMIRNILLK
ncbi:MAG: NUDIX hydrolase [Minisyncoccia bacterium]